MNEQPSPALANADHRLGWKGAMIILLYGGTLLAIGLGSSRVLTYHEVIFAEPAREMVHHGDWIMTRMVGMPSTHKPPITHWLIAASMLAFGEGEAAVRLPIVLATLAGTLLIAGLAARWYGARAGMAAGLAQLSTFYVLMQARLAEADMVLSLTVIAAMVLLAVAVVDRPADQKKPPAWMAWGFYLCVGLSFMTKFLIGPAFIFGGAGLYILIQRDWRALRFLISPVGWLICLAVVLPWCYAAYRIDPQVLQDWYLNNIGRFKGQMKPRSEPWAYYLYIAPLMLLPWTPWLAGALWLGWRERGKWSTGRWRFLLAWVAAGLAVLMASAWQAKHYLIPILAPFSVLIGWFLARDAWERIAPRLSWKLSAGLIAVGCGGGIVACWLARPDLAPAVTGIVVVAGGLAIVLAYVDHRHMPRATLAALFAVFWVAAVGVQSLVMPRLDAYRHQTVFARRVNSQVPPDQTIYLLSLPENQITYYLRFPIRRFDNPNRFVSFVQQRSPEAYYVVVPRGDLKQLQTLGQVTELDRADEVHQNTLRQVGPILLLKVESSAPPTSSPSE